MGMSQAHRGKALENAVEQANRQYLARGVAEIQFIPTPTRVVQNRRQNEVDVIRERSTVDFIGAWAGRPIAFDAKQNADPKGLPLKNIKEHQVAFLSLWERVGGVGFLLILHEPDQVVYLLPYRQLSEYWGAWKGKGPAAIPAEDLRQLPRVRAGRSCAVDYLATLEACLKT